MPISSNNQWFDYYQQSLMEDQDQQALSNGFSDATIVSSTVVSEGSSATNTAITPSSKPIRRRSRASKKTPTTLLNANANNFRALVQQFTGCPSTAISFVNQKGPVNLNFRLNNATPIIEPSFGESYDHRGRSHQPVQPQNQQQNQQFYYEGNDQLQQQQQQQCMYSSFDSNVSTNVTNDVFSSNSMDLDRKNLEISDSFAMDMSIHELTRSGFIFD